jgi:hypothetical protein
MSKHRTKLKQIHLPYFGCGAALEGGSPYNSTHVL